MARIAIVTPYCQEPPPTLERNLKSVRSQGSGCEHILVADGNPQPWLDDAVAAHIRLPRRSGDFGDTPRAVGAAFACSRDYDAVALLDADCYLLPDAVSTLWETAVERNVSLVVGRRRLVDLQGAVLDVPEEPVSSHIDTNCYFFMRAGFATLLKWALIPPPFHIWGDRVVRMAVQDAQLPYAVTTRETVVYESRWLAHYALARRRPPADAQVISQDVARQLGTQWDAMSPTKRAAYTTALGFDPAQCLLHER